MKRQLSIAISLMAMAAYAHAQSDVYLCIREDGTKEYKNTGTTKGCKKVDLPDITLVPAPQRRTYQTASLKEGEFPRVAADKQKALNDDRRRILQDEMKAEQDKLDSLRKEYNNGEPERHGDERNYAKYQERTASMKEEIDRSQENVQALERELNNIK